MGKLYVTGIGPGNEKGMTLRAREVLEECTVIVGYKTYIKLKCCKKLPRTQERVL